MSENIVIENSIEALLKNKSWYVISPFHCVYGTETNFDELEDYLLETYISIFSNKISLIVSKLICLYSAYIEVTEFFSEASHIPFELPEYEDIREIGLKKIIQVIEYVIIQGETSVNIYFSNLHSLIQISGGFDVVVFSENTNFLDSISALVNMEGLCMRVCSEK